MQQRSQQHDCVRRCLPEAQARRLFQQLIVAVDFLHHLGIANRDIKVRVRHLCKPALSFATGWAHTGTGGNSGM